MAERKSLDPPQKKTRFFWGGGRSMAMMSRLWGFDLKRMGIPIHENSKFRWVYPYMKIRNLDGNDHTKNILDGYTH